MQGNHAFARRVAVRLGAFVIAFGAATSWAADVVYLKPLGAGETRETENGESWATAYSDAATALNAAGGSNAVYAAGGYYLVGADAGIDLADGARLYGGFAGVSEAETIDGRDIKAHPTIFSGDVDQNDVWMHLEPEETGCNAVKTTLTETIVTNGTLNLPPAYSGDYDSYIPVVKGTNRKRALNVPEGVGVTIDGITFTCYTGVEGSAIEFVAKSKDSTVRNCRFFGVTGGSGAVTHNEGGYLYLEDSSFEFCTTTMRGSAVQTRGKTIIRRCTFLSCSRVNGSQSNANNGGNVIYFWQGTGSCVTDSTFCRCFNAEGGSGWSYHYGGPGNVCSAEGGSSCWLEKCVITNCYSASPYVTGTTLLGMGNGFRVSGCRIEHNCVRFTPDAVRGYFLIGVPLDGRNFTVENTIFKGNRVEALELGSNATRPYAMGIVGNGTENARYSVVGCVFDSNEVSGPTTEGGAPVLCRGALTVAANVSSTSELGVMNCTFVGPSVPGVVDVAQFGANHARALNIVNSVFQLTDAGEAKPFYFDVPKLVHLYSTTVQNMTVAPTDYAADNFTYDAIPLTTDYVPTVRTPDIRTTADVSTNSVALPVTFAFRPHGSTAWQALCPQIGGLTGTRGVTTDAKGDVRTKGAVTRGARQKMVPLAEDATAHALVLRREPLLGGTFSDAGNAQMVAADAASTPVTAVVSDPNDFTFDGWYDANGEKVSSDATLTLTTLADDTILTAKFLSPERTVTYDLGDYGTFAETGTKTLTRTARYGETFPQPSAANDAAAWHITGWDAEFPSTMPNQDLTFHATAVTKDVRVIYLVPEAEAPEDGDGTSWDKAYGNFATAYADAGQYRGEVWVKTGSYVIRDSVGLKSNVRVIGGFAGNETSADAADPAAHPSLFSGDVKGDNYWKPQNSDPGAAYRTNIVEDLTFTEQLVADEADKYWCCGGNSSDDTPYFLLANEVATNVVLQGLSFTGFGKCAVCATAGIGGLVVTNCRFVANNTTQTSDAAAIYLTGTSTFTVDDTTFYGNGQSVRTSSSTLSTNRVAGCTFYRNYASWYGGSLRVSSYGFVHVTNCVFRGNATSREASRNASCFSTGMSTANCRNLIEDCLFEGNHTSESGYGCIVTESGNTTVLEVRRCRFLRNLGSSTAHSTHAPCIVSKDCKLLLVRDSYFADNIHSTAVTDKSHASVAGFEAGKGLFLNCTFERNAMTTTATGGRYGTFVASGGHFGLVNCLVNDSVLNGGATEFVEIANADANRTFALVNSVVRNETEGYAPFSFGENLTPGLANSAVSGYDDTAIKTGNNGYVYNMTDVVPELGALEEQGGVYGRRVASDASAARAGREVWLGTDGHVYFYDTVDPSAGHWRRVVDKTQHLKDADVAKLGVSQNAPLVPDAFGASRKSSRLALGPLNAILRGFLLLVK